MRIHRPLTVGVAGGSASGKTTLIQALPTFLPPLSVSLLHHDDYYRDQSHVPRATRARINFDQPSALDNRLLARHIRALATGRPAASPRYSFRTHKRLKQTRRVQPADLVLVEGMLLLAVPSVRALFDVAVYVDAPADLRLARRILRDIGPERGRTPASVIEQYLTHVRPMHERHVKPSRHHADLVVTDATSPAQLRSVAALIERRLRDRDATP